MGSFQDIYDKFTKMVLSGGIFLLGQQHSVDNYAGSLFVRDWLSYLNINDLHLYNQLKKRILVIPEGSKFQEQKGIRSIANQWALADVIKILDITYLKLMTGWRNSSKRLAWCKALCQKGTPKRTQQEWQQYINDLLAIGKPQIRKRKDSIDAFDPIAPLVNRYYPSKKDFDFVKRAKKVGIYDSKMERRFMLSKFLVQEEIPYIGLDCPRTGYAHKRQEFEDYLSPWLQNYSGRNKEMHYAEWKEQESADNERGHIRLNAGNAIVGRRIAEHFNMEILGSKRDIIIAPIGAGHIADYEGRKSQARSISFHIKQHVSKTVPVYSILAHLFDKNDAVDKALALNKTHNNGNVIKKSHLDMSYWWYIKKHYPHYNVTRRAITHILFYKPLLPLALR